MKLDNLMNIILFTIKDVSRSKWIFMYGIIQFILTFLLISFSADTNKTIVSLLNLTIILNPVICIVFSTVYIYNSREFIELLLAQPIKRNIIFYGLYIGLSIILATILVLSIALPFIMNSIQDIGIVLFLILSGSMITFVYIALALTISVAFDDKATGLGVSILVWLFFAVIFDGLILIASYVFADYPLELPLVVTSMFNPIDMGRIIVMLKMDFAALMGYTGAVFEKFFGSLVGILMALTTLFLWIIIPLFVGNKLFKAKNF
ncbi:MAG TPA: hypothetical protein PLE30_10360 [Candidatus Kapabacteria bacterium]|nr:hypothetical protein [Candidatus Kapabacteria bacterium]